MPPSRLPPRTAITPPRRATLLGIALLLFAACTRPPWSTERDSATAQAPSAAAPGTSPAQSSGAEVLLEPASGAPPARVRVELAAEQEVEVAAAAEAEPVPAPLLTEKGTKGAIP